MAKMLMKGNEAMSLAAIKAGCIHFFGYPITPQNEIPEYMSRVLPTIEGGQFVQAESEVAAINMLYGCAGAGIRCMTSSSSPGIALKQEGISYMAGARLPAVLINVSRGGPGLGGILPAQGDYFQVTRGGGNGDYYTPVYAPAGIQEAVDLVQKSFYVAEKYRTPVFVLADGMLGQMMEPVVIEETPYKDIDKSDWQTDGTGGKREPHIINSLRLQAEGLEDLNNLLFDTYADIEKNEQMWENYLTDDAEIVISAYGTPSRICRNAVDSLRQKGIKVGLMRPITLMPFPKDGFAELPASVKHILVAELNKGQMVQDVRLTVNGKIPVTHYGRTGGVIFDPTEIEEQVMKIVKGGK